jgi:hypothetical protein
MIKETIKTTFKGSIQELPHFNDDNDECKLNEMKNDSPTVVADKPKEQNYKQECSTLQNTLP